MADRVAAIGTKPTAPKKTKDEGVNAVRQAEFDRELKAYNERLAEYKAAFGDIMGRRVVGKIVLTMDDGPRL